MSGLQTSSIEETLKRFGYEEISDMSEVAFPTIPEGFGPKSSVYGESLLENLINDPSIRFNRDSILVFEYLGEGKVNNTPLVLEVASENKFNYYCFTSDNNSTTHVVGLINSYPCFVFHVSAEDTDDTNFHWLETALTINVEPSEIKMRWGSPIRRTINRPIKNIDEVLRFLDTTHVTELFSKGYTYVGTDIMVSSVQFFGSATAPQQAWADSLKLGAQLDYLNVIDRKPLDENELKTLALHVNQDSVAKRLVYHENFTEDVAFYAAKYSKSEILLKNLVAAAQSSEIIRQCVSSRFADLAVKSVAVNHSAFPKDLFSQMVTVLPPEVLQPLLMKGMYPLGDFTAVLKLQPSHSTFSLIPILIQELMKTPEGVNILEQALIEENIAPENSAGSFPPEVIKQYSLDVFYYSKESSIKDFG